MQLRKRETNKSKRTNYIKTLFDFKNYPKRFGVMLLVMFMAITSAISLSSGFLNGIFEDNSKITIEKSSNAIFQVDSKEEKKFVKELGDKTYEKLDGNTYVVNYDSSKQAEKARQAITENNDGITSVDDSIFFTSANTDENYGDYYLKDDSAITSIPEGLTIREYADSLDYKVVAVIDTGVDFYAAESVNFTNTSNDDTNGHGTMMAVNILNNCNNKALILSLKVFQDDGYAYMSDVMKAVEYAKNAQVDIINMSIIANDSENAAPFKEQIKNVISSGITVVASAGNFNSNVQSYVPANIEGVITVGAVESGASKADFSNYGDVDYYVEADSTSQAAAILTGKLVNGDDLLQLTTKDTVEYNPDSVEKEDTYIGENFIPQAYVKFNVNGSDIDTSPAYTVYNSAHADYSNNSFGKYAIKMSQGTVTLPNASGYSATTWNCGGTSLSNGSNSLSGKVFSYDTSRTSYNGGNTDGVTFYISCSFTSGTLSVWYGHFNVNLNYPNGTESTDGGAGNFWWTTSSWGQTGGQVNDFYEDNVSYHIRVGRVHTSRGLILTTTSIGGDNMTANGHVWGPQTKTNTDVNLNTEWASATVKPNGGKWNGTTGNTTITATRVNESKDLGTPSRESVKVAFNGNSGSTPEAQYVPWYFGGWGLSTGSAVGYNGVTGYMSGNTYYYGNSIDTITAKWNIGETTLPLPTRAHYTFMGWYNGNTYVGMNGDKYSPTSDVTLTAHWRLNDYNLDINQHAANLTTSDVYEYNADYFARFDITGTLFNHGSTTVNETDLNDWNYSEVNNAYNVKSPYGMSYGSKISITAKPKAGYKYTGATTSGITITNDGNKVTATMGDSSQSSITLNYKGYDYTIKFDKNSNRGELGVPNDKHAVLATGSMANQSQRYGDPKALPKCTYEWQYHTFLGWSTDKNATTPMWTDEQVLTAGTGFMIPTNEGQSVTLYAIWSADDITVTLNPQNYGSYKGNPNTQKITQKWGTTLDVSENAFETDAPDLNVNYIVDGNTIQTDIFKWTFYGYDGQNPIRRYNGDIYYFYGPDTIDVVCGWDNAHYAPIPEAKDGYMFYGWYYDEDFKYPAVLSNVITRNPIDIYAVKGTTNINLYARYIQTDYGWDEEMEGYFQNQPDDSTGVYLAKIDADSKQVLNTLVVDGQEYGFTLEVSKKNGGKAFTLVTNDGIYDANGNFIREYSANPETGYWDITKLVDDGATYVITETDTAPGYQLSSKTEEFTVKKNSKQKIVFENKKNPIPSKTKKLDKYGREISNASFTLKDETTGKKFEEVLTIVVEENGTVSNGNFWEKSKLEAGHTYSLTETTIPEGYDKAPVYYFSLPSDGEIESISINEGVKTAKTLRIVKLNDENQPLEGAEFQLFMKNDDGEMVPCYADSNGDWTNVNTGKYMIAKTDSNGKVEFKNLPLRANYTGKEKDYTKYYYLKEVNAAKGYTVMPEIVEILLPDDGNTVFEYTVVDGNITLTLEAGGDGNAIYYELAGLGLISLAIFATFLKKRKNAKI